MLLYDCQLVAARHVVAPEMNCALEGNAAWKSEALGHVEILSKVFFVCAIAPFIITTITCTLPHQHSLTTSATGDKTTELLLCKTHPP